MQLNGAALNGTELNGAAYSSAPVLVADPVLVLPPTLPPAGSGGTLKGFAYQWWVSLLLGGEQVAARLTGSAEIDREEGAAGVATFSLYYPAGAAVPADLGGAEVRFDFISETAGETTQRRRYTGTAIEPAWDAVNRVMSITCSDQLQYRVEAMPVAAIDGLIFGHWTPDIFAAVEGRSRWDYANERLSSRPASLDASVEGQLRVTSWYATAPAVKFAPGSTMYQSIGVELAQVSSATNRVEIEVDYRYARLWQRNDSYSWEHPETAGYAGIQGFCSWRHESGELPDVPMVEQATEGAGLTMLENPVYARLPASGIYCDPPAGWTNTYLDLLLGAEWVGGRRWSQYITERYSIVLATAAGQLAGSQIISRQSTALEIEDARIEAWENDAFTSGTGSIEDLPDQARRNAVLTYMMQQAVTEVVAAHRATTISWQVPTPMALDCDLVQTIELDDQGTKARGKCRRIVDSFDFDAGVALTTISVAVMRGGGESDPLTLPANPVVGAASATIEHNLPTQLGMRNISPIYNDALDGFAGNYDQRDDDINPTLETFPRRLAITASEIPEDQRDERQVPVSAFYRVGIPNDLLEL